MAAALRLLQLLQSPSCLAGWWRHLTRFGTTRLGLVGHPSLQWSKPLVTGTRAQKREEEEKEEEEEDQDDQENEVFYGYGFFYVRLFCPGFGFQANMVEEHVLFRAFFVLLVNVRSMLAALFPVMWPRSSSLRQWHVFCWYAGDAALVVFPSLSSGPDAPHHGRYEPEGQLRSDTVWIILGESFLECFVFSAMLDASVSSPEE